MTNAERIEKLQQAHADFSRWAQAVESNLSDLTNEQLADLGGLCQSILYDVNTLTSSVDKRQAVVGM